MLDEPGRKRLGTSHGNATGPRDHGEVGDGELLFITEERTARKVYRTRDEARADVFDYIERFYNPRRRHSKLGYLSPMQFEARAMLA